MDYEKKYNEALAWMRSVYSTLQGATKEDAEHYFPELRESEDERIRGRLIQVVSAIAGGWPFETYGITKKEAIAYLEKQKYDRMKPIYDVRESFESALEKAWNDYHNGYENVDKLEDDYVECAHAKGFREGYLFGIEKQKEQKPTNGIYWHAIKKGERLPCRAYIWSQDFEKYCDCFEGRLIPNTENVKVGADTWYLPAKDVRDLPREGVDELPKEQKPVEYLSEEKVFAIMKKLTSLSFGVPLGSDEEKQIHEITCDVRGLLDYPIKPVEWNREDEQNLNVCLSYIKDEALRRWLLDVIHSKYDKPAKWSEEDEQFLLICKNALYKYQRSDQWDANIISNWLENRLKSLRPTKDCNGCSKHLEGYISGRSDAENKLLDMYGILLMPDGELRMKPRWKPSEEQIEAVRYFVNRHQSEAWAATGQWKQFTALRGLLGILQKLR